MKKITKKDKKAIKTIHTFIKGIADVVEKNKKEFIDEMVVLMKAQLDAMLKARKNGVNTAELMPEIKTAYKKKYLRPTKPGLSI